MNGDVAPRRIWLCADDYGLSPDVNRAIRELIARGRLNATSVMVLGPAIGRDEIKPLEDAAAENPHCSIGLHATLSAPFHPLTLHFRPLEGGLFPPFAKLLRAGLLRRLDPEIIRAEVASQLAAFAEKFGRAPDFVDGHQHVQLFPQVRDGFLAAVKQAAPDAWVRQGGRARPLAKRLRSPKALLLDILSVQFRHRAARVNVAFNPAFAGAYDFAKGTDFAGLMQQFIDGLPDGGLIMCHPGFIDDTLKRLDPLTDQREREHAYLAGDAFPRLLAASNVTLARPAGRFVALPKI
jgi:chitin disaccharide deacetylase